MNTAAIRTSTVAAAPSSGFLSSLWSHLSAALRGAGDRRTTHASQTSRIAEASEVRRYAQQFLSHDPRFAADLFAAADRHERS